MRELALQADGDDVVCTQELEPPPLTLSIDDLAAGAVDRGPEESLALTLTSSSGDELFASISAYTLSKQGEHSTAVTEVSLAPGETDVVSLPVADLGLPEGALENSATLILTADPRSAGGERLSASTLGLYYHPRDGGFVFYDENTRAVAFDSGALTDQARAQRDDAQLRVPPDGVVVVYTGEWLVEPAPAGAREVRP